jgi:hypothetical protein
MEEKLNKRFSQLGEEIRLATLPLTEHTIAETVSKTLADFSLTHAGLLSGTGDALRQLTAILQPISELEIGKKFNSPLMKFSPSLVNLGLHDDWQKLLSQLHVPASFQSQKFFSALAQIAYDEPETDAEEHAGEPLTEAEVQQITEAIATDSELHQQIESMLKPPKPPAALADSEFNTDIHESVIIFICRWLKSKYGWSVNKTSWVLAVAFFAICLGKDWNTQQREEKAKQQMHQQQIDATENASTLTQQLIREEGEQTRSAIQAMADREQDVITQDCKLYEKPSKRSKIIGTLKMGEHVQILGKKPGKCLVQKMADTAVVGWIDQTFLASYN